MTFSNKKWKRINASNNIFFFNYKLQPSSIIIFWPLIYFESLDNRKFNAPIKSSGSKRPLDKQFALYLLMNFLGWLFFKPPGLIQLTLIPLFFKYFAKYFVIEIIPDLMALYSMGVFIFVPLYWSNFGVETPKIEEIKIRFPKPCFLNCLIILCENIN